MSFLRSHRQHRQVMIRANVVEPLEPRRLLAATPPTFIVSGNQDQNNGSTRRAIDYFDVSALSANPGQQQGVFGQKPRLSVWVGYEITQATPIPTGGTLAARNFEEISAVAVNPINGDTYQLAFDSITGGTEGAADPVGDTQGDYDLYRINFARVYNDMIANGRPRGVMYTDATSPDGFDYAAVYGSRPTGPTGLPNVVGPNPDAMIAGDVGVPPLRNNADADPSNDFVFLTGAVDKVGEIARVQGAVDDPATPLPNNEASDPPTFDQQDLQFVDAQTLVLMENQNDSGSLDKQIRLIRRTATTPGGATRNVDPAAPENLSGGYNRQTSETWQSVILAGGTVALDGPAPETSDVDGMRYVERNGVRGVWVSERDRTNNESTTGDRLTFFAIDFAAQTATRRNLSSSGGVSPDFKLDDSTPAPGADRGEVGWFDVDELGNLVIEEAGFGDVDTQEPELVNLRVTNYGVQIAVNAAPTTTGDIAIPAAADDDTVITDDRFGLYERGQDYAYIFDDDVTVAGTATTDVYVVDVDPASPTYGQVVYSERDAIYDLLSFSDANKLRSFTLGDYFAQDGLTDARDIDALYDRVADPTAGGRFPAPVGREMFDLSGDDNLTGNPGSGGDADVLVRRVLNTQYGDANLDGAVGQADFGLLASNFGRPGRWATGDFNGDDVVGQADFGLLASNFGFNNAPGQPLTSSARASAAAANLAATPSPVAPAKAAVATTKPQAAKQQAAKVSAASGKRAATSVVQRKRPGAKLAASLTASARFSESPISSPISS